eukprot:5808735-Alexandrium_andersonii.AAC.1
MAECGLGNSNSPFEEGNVFGKEYVGIDNHEAEQSMSEAVDELNCQADARSDSFVHSNEDQHVIEGECNALSE